MTHTKDLLADALKEIGLDEMSAKAREGYYHDYMSPLDLPTAELMNQLAVSINNTKDETQKTAIMYLRSRVMNGDFDASIEESDEWAASPEGQEAFRKLMRKE